MSDLLALDQAIRERLSAAEQRRRHQQARLKAEMAEHDQLMQRFDRLATRAGGSIVRPRLQQLAGCFDNATLLACDSLRPYRCVCLFDRTPTFPATTRLEFALFHNDLIDQGHLVYNLEILPIFFQFDKQDRFDFPLDRLDEGRLAEWVDAKVLAFVDTYMRLAEIEYYQRENLVIDPVCGMLINKQFAAGHAELKGQVYYFCVDDCRKKFLDDPSRYQATGRA